MDLGMSLSHTLYSTLLTKPQWCNLAEEIQHNIAICIHDIVAFRAIVVNKKVHSTRILGKMNPTWMSNTGQKTGVANNIQQKRDPTWILPSSLISSWCVEREILVQQEFIIMNYLTHGHVVICQLQLYGCFMSVRFFLLSLIKLRTCTKYTIISLCMYACAYIH